MSADFVAVDDYTWVQVPHIISVVEGEHPSRCEVYVIDGRYVANCSAKDFLNRMVGAS